ncbi:MAG: biopolymer transporter ExbD [Gammaproteobacteria bacterium]
MRRLRKQRQRHQTTAELNITAFMNLMVVLVPFLLMTAVFTHMSILELNLPKPGEGPGDAKDPAFELQLIIKKDALVIADNKGGIIKTLPVTQSTHQFAQLTETLKQVKARFPDKSNITILAEQDTTYDTLVQAMDAVRSYKALHQGEAILAELFPDISIGDAPR